MKLTLDELHLEIQVVENLTQNPRTLFPPWKADRNLPRSIMGYVKFPSLSGFFRQYQHSRPQSPSKPALRAHHGSSQCVGTQSFVIAFGFVPLDIFLNQHSRCISVQAIQGRQLIFLFIIKSRNLHLRP